MSKITLLVVACGLALIGQRPALSQQIDCQRLMDALINSPPGVYSPQQAQEMAAVYNRECLPQQGAYQQQYQQAPQQQQSDAEAAGEAIGQFLGALMRR